MPSTVSRHPVRPCMTGLSTLIRARAAAALLLAVQVVLGPATAARADARLDEMDPPRRDALAAPYVDGSFGFSLKPPAVCAIIREKRPMSTADVEVVRFQNNELSWSLSVRFVVAEQPLDTQTLIEGITDNLVTQHESVDVLHGESARIAGREGVRYMARFTADGDRWLRQQAVVRFKPTEYFALVFLTPEEDRVLAADLFDRVVASFEILRTEAAQQRLQAAIDRGRAVLDAFRNGSRRLPGREHEERFLRLLMEGKEIGYVEVHQQAGELNYRDGIHVQEIGWLFQPDGGTTHMRNVMFLADDLSWEIWDNWVLTVLPPEDNQPRQSLLEVEQGLRTDETLLVAYSPAPNATELRDKAIEVDGTYASAAWHALLPRIIDLTKPEIYNFSAYNSSRRGLALRTYEVAGASSIRLDGRTVPAVRIEDSEGLIPPVNEIYVDNEGRLLRVVAGPLEMVQTSKRHIERRYADRVREANALMNRLNIRPPVPGRRDDPAPR